MNPQELRGMPCPVCSARSRVIRTIDSKTKWTIGRKRVCEGNPQHTFDTVEYIIPKGDMLPPPPKVTL
jgi:hypothetical protein